MPEFDGPWKEALTALFRHLLRLYRPADAEQVNWSAGLDSLETEMQKLLPTSQTGVKRVDKLFKVSLHSKEVRYYHVEVQCWPDEDFEYRVYTYNNVAELFCGDPVDSLIVLGDNDPKWLPDGFAWQGGGTLQQRQPVRPVPAGSPPGVGHRGRRGRPSREQTAVASPRLFAQDEPGG